MMNMPWTGVVCDEEGLMKTEYKRSNLKYNQKEAD